MKDREDMSVMRLKDTLSLAKRYNHERYDYLSHLSNQIRDPMSVIIGITNLVLSKENDPQKLNDYIKKIQSSSNILLDLMNKWMDSSIFELNEEEKKIEEIMNLLNQKQQDGVQLDSDICEEVLGVCFHLNGGKEKECRFKQEDLQMKGETAQASHPQDFHKGFNDGNEISLEGRRVLVVEDNEINRDVTKMLLNMKNAQVHTAENGQEAVEAFMQSETHFFDVILMDIQMPVKDGFEATRDIRALEREDAKLIPIIATTVNAMPEDVKKALQSGMNAHIGKPVDTEKLFWIINSYVNHPML